MLLCCTIRPICTTDDRRFKLFYPLPPLPKHSTSSGLRSETALSVLDIILKNVALWIAPFRFDLMLKEFELLGPSKAVAAKFKGALKFWRALSVFACVSGP